jgi:putative transposase
MMIQTFKYRVKDKKQNPTLRELSWKANQIWNACVAVQKRFPGSWFSHFDLVNYTKSLGNNIKIHSDTRSSICKQFVSSRNTHKRIPRFRKSGGSKRSLGWIPFISRAVKIQDDCVTYQKIKFKFRKHREHPEKILTGCFVEDSEGKWFVAFTAEVSDLDQAPDESVGIDLGLKTMASLSNGEKIEIQKFYRKYENN